MATSKKIDIEIDSVGNYHVFYCNYSRIGRVSNTINVNKFRDFLTDKQFEDFVVGDSTVFSVNEEDITEFINKYQK